ncbi:hypothetical protein ACVMDO_001501 [Bradyrhizobium sp. USDA 4513]
MAGTNEVTSISRIPASTAPRHQASLRALGKMVLTI